MKNSRGKTKTLFFLAGIGFFLAVSLILAMEIKLPSRYKKWLDKAIEAWRGKNEK